MNSIIRLSQDTRQHGSMFAACMAIATFAVSAGLAGCSNTDNAPEPAPIASDALPPGNGLAANPNSTAKGISSTAPDSQEKSATPPDTNASTGMSKQQESSAMPAPGQNNDHSSTDKGTAPAVRN